jgi:hypothetical protein
VHSFLAQTLQNFKLLILHDGYDEQMDHILAGLKKSNPGVIDYFFTDERYNDYGHTLRDIGIGMVDTEFVLITNDDNYYCPVFLERVFLAIKERHADIVLCDMIHSHSNPGGRPQLPYCLFKTGPTRLSIDIGCFVARSEWAKTVGFKDKTHDGDASFFEDLLRLRPNARVAKVNQVLFVHN